MYPIDMFGIDVKPGCKVVVLSNPNSKHRIRANRTAPPIYVGVVENVEPSKEGFTIYINCGDSLVTKTCSHLMAVIQDEKGNIVV
jgi:hypothetical protein